MIVFTTFLAGLIVGYWLYPVRMAFKLYKISKKLKEVELQHLAMMEELKGKQWNEDNL